MHLRRNPIVFALISLGVFIRLAIWYLLPTTRFASDEGSYYRVGIELSSIGYQDIFLPPVTSWLIAAINLSLPSAGIRYLRLFWVLMDIAAVALVVRLAARVFPESDGKQQWFAGIAAVSYILYVPAISYSQFLTSETPAVLLLLCVLVLVTSDGTRYLTRLALAGVLVGLLVLTRSNLAGLLISFPVAIAIASTKQSFRRRITEVLVFASLAASITVGWAIRNYYHENEFTLSSNSDYNLYIGNSPAYQEDLNLFSPFATAEQIAFRRQILSGTGPKSSFTSQQMRAAAIDNILENKMLFLRRVLGRLARIFVPRTDQLELLQGEAQAGVFSKSSLSLTLFTNLQWVVVLFAGAAGLLSMGTAQRRVRVWFSATILGSIPLCLIAISKPRYAFVFDSVSIICACFFLLNWKENWHYLLKRHKYLYGSVVLFFVWAWIAWLIFAISSRISLG